MGYLRYRPDQAARERRHRVALLALLGLLIVCAILFAASLVVVAAFVARLLT